ncbi:DUF1090 domain-containing protein [Vibrio sp. CJQ_6]|uniref:DUF1090 domain-containing protein n=1 Tax=Vibrio sp. CJQ_6 TaxID=3367165 RepID=UPI003709F895
MIKKSLCVGLLALLPLSHALADEALKGCAAKEHAILEQIESAKKYDNQRKLEGLEEALSQVRQHCTDEGLLRNRQAKVRKQEREVEERIQDLKDAQASGKQDKIKKRMRKLEEAKAELEEAKAELLK